MANTTTQSLVRQIEAIYGGESVTGLTDRQLIELFLTRRGSSREDAFAVLVARHGPMVLGVCQHNLAGHEDAEDAFQAVFLVLATRAGSIRTRRGSARAVRAARSGPGCRDSGLLFPAEAQARRMATPLRQVRGRRAADGPPRALRLGHRPPCRWSRPPDLQLLRSRHHLDEYDARRKRPTARSRRDARLWRMQSPFITDPINYPKEPQTDGQGRITFPALIPGATYKITDETKSRVTFTVKPGETRDLGDIPFEKSEE
jgi:hypothetical protein